MYHNKPELAFTSQYIHLLVSSAFLMNTHSAVITTGNI